MYSEYALSQFVSNHLKKRRLGVHMLTAMMNGNARRLISDDHLAVIIENQGIIHVHRPVRHC